MYGETTGLMYSETTGLMHGETTGLMYGETTGLMYGETTGLMHSETTGLISAHTWGLISPPSAVPFRVSARRDSPRPLREGCSGVPCYGFPLLSTDLTAGQTIGLTVLFL